MDEQRKASVKKVVTGGALVAGGVATTFGYGLFSFLSGKHHMTLAGSRVGGSAIEKGVKMLDDGLRELKG